MLYFVKMKGLIFLLLLLLFSCDKKVKTNLSQNVELPQAEDAKESKSKDRLYNHPWFLYYQKENPEFNPKLFQFTQTSPITFRATTVKILNTKGFNEIYKPFIIFSESNDKYIDIDSYQWFLQPDGSAGFEADQQIVLVDYKKKTAKQIAFFGPSFWIEDAFWKGDSVAVLLGNTYEKVPFMMKYNFEKNKVQHFQYPDTLKIETPYSKMRLHSKGIKVE